MVFQLKVPLNMNNEQRHQTSNANLPVARILFSDSGRGLYTDAELLQQVLEANGWRVQWRVLPRWSVRKTRMSQRFAKAKKLLPDVLSTGFDNCQIRLSGMGRQKVDLQIHLESLAVEYLAAATCNWLIPNQEWVRPQHLCFFRHLDRVLCKTREAQEILQRHHHDVRYLGFSNPIAAQLPEPPSSPGRFRRFLHVAGRNRKKGSQAIVEAWRRHPEWPELQLVMDHSALVGPLPGNVRLWSGIDDARLAALRKEHGVVLAPSEVEGFGHILLEGMAYQAVVLTTDAAPMNELVTIDRGWLIPWNRQEPCHLGTRYHVPPEAVERAVETILQTPAGVLNQAAIAARDWVDSNHRCFLVNLSGQLGELWMPSIWLGKASSLDGLKGG